MKTTSPRICLCLEQLEDRVLPSAAPSIQMTFATTTDSRTLSVNYTISGESFTGQNLSFNIYRTAAYNSLSGGAADRHGDDPPFRQRRSQCRSSYGRQPIADRPERPTCDGPDSQHLSAVHRGRR